MALRQLNIENHENIGARPANKGLIANKQVTHKTERAAFGELGNKLQVRNVGVLIKKDARPPTKVVRKPSIKSTNTAAVKEKENAKKNEEIAKKRETKPKILEEKKVSKIEKLSYSTKRLEDDVDPSEKNDPLLMTEYVQDIYDYLREMEIKYSIKPQFLTSHRSTPRMRSVLVNWMVDVHLNFSFLNETLHLAVAIVDRYLQDDKTVGRETLQLVGVGAFLVAGKYEEMYLPDMEDFVYISDNIYSLKQILKMEQHILQRLGYCLGRPLSIHFLRRFSKIGKVKPEHHVLGKYLLELALVHYELCHYHPSIQAAAALCFSIAILNECSNAADGWSETLAKHTSYSFSDIRLIMILMADVLVKAESSKYQAVRTKYSSSKFAKISLNPKLKGTLVKCLALKMNKDSPKST